MATAATPLTQRPIKIRINKNTDQRDSIELSIHKIAINAKEQIITGLRPKRSEISPVNSRPMAKARVERDKGKLLRDGLAGKKCATRDIRGCRHYKDETKDKREDDQERRHDTNH